MILLLALANATISRSDILEFSGHDAGGAITAAEASARGAFDQIKAADREGGNVTILASSFNEALEMLDRAKAYADEGLDDLAITTAEIARQLFDAIGNEAIILQGRAAADASYRRLAILSAAPISAISITLFAYFLIRLWRRRGIERIMEMEVRATEAEAGTGTGTETEAEAKAEEGEGQ